MKIGIDIHGTIDKYPEMFNTLLTIWYFHGIEIHLTTGKPVSIAEQELEELGIYFYNELFSIIDYHKSIGTKIIYDKNGNPWIDPDIWNRTKADYCEREGIDLHIDNSPIYGKHFKTPYMRFEGKKLDNVLNI